MSAPHEVPPADLDAEGSVLCMALLADESADEAISLLGSRDIYADANRHIFEAIVACREAGEPVGVVTVAARLRDNGRLQQVGGTPYLAQLADSIPTVAHLQHYCKLISDKARQRRAIALCRKYVAEGYAGVEDVDAWLHRLEADVYDAARSSSSQANSVSYRDLMVQVMKHVRDAHDGKIEMGLRTGFRRLDNHIGGWCAGHLWYLAGRPGMGKTALAIQCGETAVEYVDEPSVCGLAYSLEMKAKDIGLRSAARQSELPGRQVRNGRLQTREQWKKLGDSAQYLGRLPLRIDDAPDLTPLLLRQRIRHDYAQIQRDFGRKLRLGFVIIDYVQLMGVDKDRGENRQSQLEDISRKLKILAREFDTCVVALSQLTRLDKDKKAPRPTMADLRGSGALEQDADVALAIHREDYYRGPGEKRDHLAELIVMKGRNAGEGTHLVHFDGRFTGFFDTAETGGDEDEHD